MNDTVLTLMSFESQLLDVIMFVMNFKDGNDIHNVKGNLQRREKLVSGFQKKLSLYGCRPWGGKSSGGAKFTWIVMLMTMKKVA